MQLSAFCGARPSARINHFPPSFARSAPCDQDPANVLAPCTPGAPRLLGKQDGACFALFVKSGIRVIATASTAMVMAILLPAYAPAAELETLARGSYLPNDTSCDFVGSAPTINFDGSNLSGHYQMCLTKPLNGKEYRSDCLEGQGQDWPTASQIAGSPNKESETFSLKINSRTSFTKNATKYRLCP